LDDTGALRYNPSTGTLLVPNLNVAGTTTQVNTVTMEAANAVVFEGATSDAHETTLSIVDPTADHTQYLINQGGYIPVLAAATTTAITSTPAELNVLDGYTGSVTELNYLDTLHATGVTATEFDYLDGVTSNIQTQLDAKVEATLTSEQVQDIVGAMFTGNTETNIAATYEDGDGTIDLAVTTGAGGLTNIVSDTSPQLGGDLDVQTNEIKTTSSNRDIVLRPHGTGGVVIYEAGESFPASPVPNKGKLTVVHDGHTGPALLLTDADADSFSGPNLNIYRDSSSPASGDDLGKINWHGNNNNAEQVLYGSIFSEITTTTDGSEDGTLVFGVMEAGTHTTMATLTGTGLGIGDTTPSSPLTIYHAVTNPALDGIGGNAFAQDINIDLSGSGATGGQREQGGLFIDLDTSATGGDTSNEHRAFGIWVDADQTGAADADAFYGIYSHTESNRSSASTSNTTNQIGVYGYAVSDETVDNTVTSLQGVRGDFSLQDNGVVTTSYGLRAHGDIYKNRNANVGALNGVAAELQVSGGRTSGNSGSDTNITTGAAKVFSAVLDHNVPSSGESTVTIANSYLYYGNSSITDSAQVTNNYGMYITGETKNYFSGKVGIGTTSPSEALHIRSSSDHPLVLENDQNAAYVGIQFSDHASGSYGQKGELRFNHADSSSQGSGASFHFTTTESDLSIVGGKFISAVGSASEPGFSFSGDTNVGMFRPAANELAFSVVNEAMRIDSNANVGIGTTSPDATLHVNGGSGEALPLILERPTTGGANYGVGIEFVMGDADSATAKHIYGRMLACMDGANGNVNGSEDGYLRFDTSVNGTITEHMRILSSGNVGIGTTTPSAPLTITADTDGGDTLRLEGSDSNGNLSTPDLTLTRTNGSPGGNTWLGHIHFKGMNNASGTNEELTYASIAGQIDAGSDGSEKGRLKFYTMDSGTNTLAMTIDENQVGIGVGEPETKLHVDNGTLQIGLQADDYYTQLSNNALMFHRAGASYIDQQTDNGDIRFRMNAANTDLMMLDGSAMRVGIGTTSPGGKLHVEHSGTTGHGLKVYRNQSSSNMDSALVYLHDDSGYSDEAVLHVKQDGTGLAVKVEGALQATTKSFDIEHPTEEGKRLHHGSLEGPEHGVYIRGRLEGDTIELPDYWLGLVDEDTITVQLTPNKGFQQIYVDHIEDNKVYVGTQTDTPIDCFYFIQAERKDVEKMVVEY